MSSFLRTTLLCAALFLSSSLSVVLSTESPLLRLDPSQDGTETLFTLSHAVEAAPEPASYTPRADSMEGGRDSLTAASDDSAFKPAAVEAEHTMHTMQASGSQWTMTRRTDRAPFSHRIQPGLMYRTREISYTQTNGNRVRLGAGYLMLYEGAMTNSTGPITRSVENDVWVSNDDGMTWDLVAGRSEYGPGGPTSSVNNGGQTFVARSGSNNCNDPQSDLIVSLGGNDPVTLSSTNATYTSYNGVQWLLQPSNSPFLPIRHFSSCDITERGDILLIGGHFHTSTNQPADYLLNDVWRGTGVLDSAYQLNWQRQTAAAPFAAREEHLVLVSYSSALKKEITYVIGGKTTCNNPTCYDGTNSNDVWASSDYGTTWAQLTANAAFGPRWGHGGWATKGEALLVWGGLNSPTGLYGDTVTWRDMWASFDGGYTFQSCNVGGNTAWIRGEQGAVVNANGQLLVVAGYAYQENGFQQVRYNDVWRSNFSVDSTEELAARCSGNVPAAGAGLRRWPGTTPSTTNVMTFTPATLRAPWSPRYKAGLLHMSQPLTYKTPEGVTANTGADWLLLYEGMGLVSAERSENENDVYASADNGQTWTMIAGQSIRGQQGNRVSAHRETSFISGISAANCEDPLTDDVYTIGGLRYFGDWRDQNDPSRGFYSTNDVWYSTNALIWNHTVFNFARRHAAACDVGHSRNIILVGGASRAWQQTPDEIFFNDVWQSKNQGRTWSVVSARAPFAPRRDHAMQIVASDYYGVDLVYVVGGRGAGTNGAMYTNYNDVWVSSNAGGQWKAVTARAQFSPRFQMNVVVTSWGAMLMIGGRGQSDIWASLDGGAAWRHCNTASNSSVSGDASVAMTVDNRLVVASGAPRADVQLLDQPLSTAAILRRYCGSLTAPSDGGYGLRMSGWTGNGTNSDDDNGGDQPGNNNNNNDSSSSGGLSGLAIVGIVAAVLVALAVAYGYWRWSQKNSSGATHDPNALLGGSTGSVEGQTHNALDSALMHDTDNRSSL